MLTNFFDNLFKAFSGKNISYLVLLLLTFSSGYLVWDFTSTLLKDNRAFITSLNEVSIKLEKIYEILSIHEKNHEKQSKTEH